MRPPRLKWWQWAIGGVVAVGVASALFSPPDVAAPAPGRIVSASQIGGSLPVYAAVSEPGTPAADAEAKARELCGAASHCDVMAWADHALKAKGFPMTDREAAGVVYRYRVNRTTGYEASSWNCETFPDAPAAQCMG